MQNSLGLAQITCFGGNACLKDFRYGANTDFWLDAMGQIPILLMGQTMKILIVDYITRYLREAHDFV